EDRERFVAEEARRIEDDNRRRQVREEAARLEEERRQADEVRRVEENAAPQADAPAEASTEEVTPASQRNAGPSSVRIVAGRPGQPPRPPRAERPSNTRPESERGAGAALRPSADRRPSGTATRPA